MKKAIIFISMSLVVGGILYQIIQTRKVTAELAGGYPALSIFEQIRKACVNEIKDFDAHM